MKKIALLISLIAILVVIVPRLATAVQPSDFNLKEGDIISATGDPDVYIVNENGYKRLFVNPAIFNLYGHLGWNKIKKVSPEGRDAFITSGLFRNCESNNQRVYGLDVISEDVANLRWVNTSAMQAVADDPNFFKRVFCINTAEQRLYTSGSEYASVRQIPDYNRTSSGSSVTPHAELVVPNKIVAGYETTVLVKGSGFRQGAQVDFGAGATKPSFTVIDDGQIKVTIPANMPALVYNIAITNPNGQSIILKDALTVQQPATTSSTGLTAAQIFSKVAPSTVLITNNSNTIAGSGAVISSDGYILTNDHVITGYNTVKVFVSSTGNTPYAQYTGTVLGHDSTNDLAIVKISASGLQPIDFGGSSEANLPGGSQIYALGFPLVFNIGATSVKILDGIVVGRLGTSFIQVSANIQPGNSGGPLVNNQGKLVGINNWCITTTKLCQQGYGFAIPVDFITPLISGLKSPQYTPQPTLPPTPLPTIPPTPTPTPTPTPIPSSQPRFTGNPRTNYENQNPYEINFTIDIADAPYFAVNCKGGNYPSGAYYGKAYNSGEGVLLRAQENGLVAGETYVCTFYLNLNTNPKSGIYSGGNASDTLIMAKDNNGVPITKVFSFTTSAPTPTSTPTPTPTPSPTTTPTPTSEPFLSSGLIGYWSFDDASGTSINDSSSENNHGSIISSTPRWINGKINSGLSFDGVNDYASIPHSSTINLGGISISNYSVALWYRTSQPSALAGRIIGKDDGSGVYPFAIDLESNTGRAWFRNGDGNITSAKSVTDNQWHHIVVVREADSRQLRIYIDGVEDEDDGKPFPFNYPENIENGDNIWIARQEHNGNYDEYSMSIDELRIYNKTLSLSEIQSLYNQ